MRFNCKLFLRTLNPPKFGLKLPVWPISPILSFYRPQNREVSQQQQRGRCDSPEASVNFLKFFSEE